MAKAIIQSTKIFWAVNARRYMEENDVRSTFVGTGLELKIKKDDKFLIQILRRQKFFNLNSDTLQNF